jgi:hypothetical protein
MKMCKCETGRAPAEAAVEKLERLVNVKLVVLNLDTQTQRFEDY